MSMGMNKIDLIPHVFVEKVHNWRGRKGGPGDSVSKKIFKNTPSTLATDAINCFIVLQLHQERDKEMVTLSSHFKTVKKIQFTNRS